MWNKGGNQLELIIFLFLGIGTYFDVKRKELPIPIFICFGSIALIWGIFFSDQKIGNMILGSCVGFCFLLTGWFSKEAIGYGDGMGLTILGMLEGWPQMIPVIIGAFLLSGIYGVWRLIGCGDSLLEELPFYPFLLIAFTGVTIL
jgi:leader peptidase (prepilin peptidase)/N-methyltransferase